MREVSVRRLPAAGLPIRHLGLPGNLLILSVRRNGELIIPHGNTRIEPGDRVYLNDIPTPGEAISAPDGSGDFEVNLGALRARINVKQVASVDKATHAPAPAYQEAPREFAFPKVAPELDLRGMTVDEAARFFAEEAGVSRSLEMLRSVGVGYLRLGQPATELSGGEAQRIKLATELQRTARGDTLYVLDEPTTGLHPVDVERLVVQLNGLVDAGNTVVVVEHDVSVAGQSDWVIEVGPGAGEEGGRVSCRQLTPVSEFPASAGVRCDA